MLYQNSSIQYLIWALNSAALSPKGFQFTCYCNSIDCPSYSTQPSFSFPKGVANYEWDNSYVQRLTSDFTR